MKDIIIDDTKLNGLFVLVLNNTDRLIKGEVFISKVSAENSETGKILTNMCEAITIDVFINRLIKSNSYLHESADKYRGGYDSDFDRRIGY